MKSVALVAFALPSLLPGSTPSPGHRLSASHIIHVCGSHPGTRYASIAVRGYFVRRVVSIERGKGGAGALYVRRHRQWSLRQGDTMPFVQVNWRGHAESWIPAGRVVVRGSLSCVALSPGDFPAVAARMIARSWMKAR